MRPYVNCWKVTDLAPWDLQKIKELGFVGIRGSEDTPAMLERACEMVMEYDLQMLAIIDIEHGTTEEIVSRADAQAAVAAGPIAFEIGNEPDISPRWADDWDGFGKLVNACATEGVRGRFPVVSGGTFSSTARGLEWLVYAERWMDPSVILGVHSYRQNGTPERQQTPWRSRDGELHMIKALASPRPVWCTEMGWHTANFPSGLFGWGRKHWTDEQVLHYLADEFRVQANHGTDVVVVYQWTDGPSKEGIDRYGLKLHQSQTLKPQAQCVQLAGFATG
jgi:hypothetical protein